MGLCGYSNHFFFGCTVSMKDLSSTNWGLTLTLTPHTHILTTGW